MWSAPRRRFAGSGRGPADLVLVTRACYCLLLPAGLLPASGCLLLPVSHARLAAVLDSTGSTQSEHRRARCSMRCSMTERRPCWARFALAARWKVLDPGQHAAGDGESLWGVGLSDLGVLIALYAMQSHAFYRDSRVGLYTHVYNHTRCTVIHTRGSLYRDSRVRVRLLN